ncbi:MAG TPA: hypothetical protein VKJ00_10130 [Thermoanaerobaculia bacterium]|nr:hypothetical protein [Thermoanaerobaculia bacterium]
MLHEPGPDLDRLIARRLGDSAPQAEYSVEPAAADRLIARLEQTGLRLQSERADELWYCALSAGTGQRLATGSGPTRELALCRAVSNLPEFAVPNGSNPCPPAAERPRRKRAAVAQAAVPEVSPPAPAQTSSSGVCEDCGAALPRVRALSHFCPVCSYRRGRQARIDFEARRRSRRRRPPAAG